MKGEESKGTARCLARTSVRTNCYLVSCGRLWKDRVCREDKELGPAGVVFETSVRSPVARSDRWLDTETWDSCQRYLFGSFQNTDDLSL